MKYLPVYKHLLKLRVNRLWGTSLSMCQVLIIIIILLLTTTFPPYFLLDIVFLNPEISNAVSEIWRDINIEQNSVYSWFKTRPDLRREQAEGIRSPIIWRVKSTWRVACKIKPSGWTVSISLIAEDVGKAEEEGLSNIPWGHTQAHRQADCNKIIHCSDLLPFTLHVHQGKKMCRIIDHLHVPDTEESSVSASSALFGRD